MEYVIDYLPDKGYVAVKNVGRLNFQKAEKYSKDAIKLARQNDCSKFLFDHRATKISGGVNKIHTYGEELQQFGFKDTDHIAIILSDKNDDFGKPDQMDQNSRWSDIKYFSGDNFKEADTWLASID
ncbi:MAG: hypothetical protein V1720_10155 [bacterium]